MHKPVYPVYIYSILDIMPQISIISFMHFLVHLWVAICFFIIPYIQFLTSSIFCQLSF